jgi:hypothetical protein
VSEERPLAVLLNALVAQFPHRKEVKKERTSSDASLATPNEEGSEAELAVYTILEWESGR